MTLEPLRLDRRRCPVYDVGLDTLRRVVTTSVSALRFARINKRVVVVVVRRRRLAGLEDLALDGREDLREPHERFEAFKRRA